MLISICMVAYNEEKTLSKILADITSQDYPRALTELVFVDNASRDGTYAALCEFKDRYLSEYKDILVLQNDSSVLSSGLNLGLDAFTGEAFVRIDAHASLSADFISETVACLEGTHTNVREDVCGGVRPTYTTALTGMAQLLLSAEQSRFGASAASYRGEPERCYVDSIFHAAYRREVIEKVGKFNEKLWRTEDNEYNCRVRDAGYRICFEPRIKSKQQIRSSLSKMLKQKNQNGYWVGYTLGVYPKCLGLFHFVPLAFVAASVVCALLGAFGLGIFGALMWGLYGLCAVGFSIKAILDTEHPHVHHLLLPVVFLLMHICYGVGTLWGMFKFLTEKKK